ncbi:DUF4139 domain-containing protein [Marinobacterium litorale]|uniref:DUF4139 domain-containing protein n=1 Tax=Marinobacterium litorale TaxID=404770 RepID=UPI000409CAEA|nr:DUF4139 domain-containing protein [Marinobacterium litorale]
MNRYLLTLASSLLLTASAQASSVLGEQERIERSLTIYQQDLALFTERYRIDTPLQPPVRITDVSQLIQPESLLTGPSGTLSSIRFRGEVPNFNALLSERLGQPIRLQSTQTGEERQVELVAVDGNGILISDQSHSERIAFDSPWRILLEPAAQYSNAPYLELNLTGHNSDSLQLDYLSSGMGWNASYHLKMLPETERIRLEGRATIHNQTGTDIQNSRVKLLAGDVNQPRGGAPRMYAMEALSASRAPSPAQREALQDYQLYTLPQPVTLPNGEAVTLPLQAPIEMDVATHYRFSQQVNSGTQREALIGHPRKEITFTLPDTDEQSAPLPAGSARVFSEDSESGLLYIGGQQLPSSAAGEEVTLTLGEAFDLTVEQTQTAYERQGQALRIGYQIEVRNSGEEPRQVELSALFGQSRILLESQPAATEKGPHLEWVLDVPANGKVSVEYSVRLL